MLCHVVSPTTKTFVARKFQVSGDMQTAGASRLTAGLTGWKLGVCCKWDGSTMRHQAVAVVLKRRETCHLCEPAGEGDDDRKYDQEGRNPIKLPCHDKVSPTRSETRLFPMQYPEGITLL